MSEGKALENGGPSSAQTVQRDKGSRKRSHKEAMGGDRTVEDMQKEKAAQVDKEVRKRMKKYVRGLPPALKKLTDKKLKGALKAKEQLFGEAALTAAKTEQWLLPGEGGFLEAEGVERTANIKQEDIVAQIGLAPKRNAFDLRLPQLGPYCVNYTRNGRFLLLGGEKGHLAMVDWRKNKLVSEIQVKEKVRDVQFLHNEMFYAAAQKKYVYIYDQRGFEVHCLKEQRDIHRLEFLPHHFLLATVGKSGVLQYVDTTTGQISGMGRTKRGRCDTMYGNPLNGILHLGHSNGTVTLWSPNLTTPLVTILCHRGPVTSVTVNFSGQNMVTTGLDGRLKIWDLRTYKELDSYYTPSPASFACLSQKDVLAVSYGSGIQLWKGVFEKKQKLPYMTHRVFGGSDISGIQFVPYEDVLGIGHKGGFSSIIVPGSGEANFDSFVDNPFETRKQRQEKEIHQLLDKLQPDMIVLDPKQIGLLENKGREWQKGVKELENSANRAARKEGEGEKKTKNKQKGRNKASRRHKKKQVNIVEEKKPKIAAQMRKKQRVSGNKEEEEEGEVR